MKKRMHLLAIASALAAGMALAAPTVPQKTAGSIRSGGAILNQGIVVDWGSGKSTLARWVMALWIGRSNAISCGTGAAMGSPGPSV